MRQPKYRRHSTRDFAFVEHDGVRHRLPGAFDSPESRKAYDAFLKTLVQSPVVQAVTIEVLVATYLDFAQSHFRGKFGRSTYHQLTPLFRRLLADYRHLPATEFGPRKLKEFRQSLIDAKHARTTINLEIGHIRRMFRYGVSEELIPASAWEALRSVGALQAKRTEARETEPRSPVSWDHVAATLPYLTSQVSAMVQAQWWIGCRSESIVLARGSEFDTDQAVWQWKPRHKMERKRVLVLAVGPRAQEQLRPYMDRTPYLFSPRRTRPSKRFRDHYDSHSYRASIALAAERAGVPHWTPHQLRHARATAIREKFGVEAAQAVIGHEHISATELYSSKAFKLAEQIALELG